MRNTLSAMICATCVIAGSPSNADAQAQSEMQTLWTVQAGAMPSTYEVRPRSMEVFLKQKLLPTGIATLASSITSDRIPGGILPAGSQLFKVTYASAAIYCAINRREGNKVDQFISWNLPAWPCFVDANGDGQFEATFLAKSKVKGLPNIAGPLPTNLTPITPTRYTIGSPETLASPFWVGIQYVGRVLGSPPLFAITFGNEAAQASLTGTIRAAGAIYPRQVIILGAELTVSIEDKDTVAIRVDRTIPSQLFGVQTFGR